MVSTTATPSEPSDSQGPERPAEAESGAPGEGLHDFDAQKRIHQQIRNDPDYDDWEYGTEPLPHEAWIPRRAGAPAASQAMGEGRSAGG
ncbi:MAG: hypothetical protein VKP70_11395 [Cyanobacteriota bacterium]|nr:hypothetical protein [Cyanobacteriota bacterium]